MRMVSPSALSALPAVLLIGAATAALQTNPATAQDWVEVPMEAGTFHEYADGYRTDTIDIPLDAYGELEYKLALEEGDSLVYSWQVVDMEDPQLLYSEFHGHTERVGDAPGTLMYYRKANGGTESGALVAPFTGIHGWYLLNDSDAPIVVRLEVAGFYDLIDQ